MGVSRSASTVIAYAMKEYGWSLEKAYNFVKEKRNITRPNPGFMRQLAEYEGILDASKQRHNKLWQPDTDCEMADSQQGLTQHCGGEEGEHLTPEPGLFHCCEEELSEKGAACPSQYRTVALEIDPAYNNYYFRRLSDSALDSEPSTPVRGPPLLSMEKVFIEIDDVERDALLDDEAFDGQEGLPLSHLGPTAEGTAAQTCGRGPEPLEELRLRLEFSTVEEEDEEEVQKEEAEMEVLMQPDEGGGGEGNRSETQDAEGDAEGMGMDLATLNENSNNNNRLSFVHDCNENAPVILLPSDTSMLSRLDQTKSCWKNESLAPTPKLCLNPSSTPKVPSAIFPQSHNFPEGVPSSVELLCPCGPLCNCANCAASLPAAPFDKDENPGESGQPVELEDVGTFLDINTDTSERHSAGMPEETQFLWKQQESLLQLHQSGLVRQRAERLERLSGLSQQSLQTLKPLQTCQRSQKCSPHDNKEEESSSFAGDLANSSTPCQVRSECPMVPLTNESLFGALGSGLFTPTSSPHGSTLTRSSSSDSLRSVRGKPGLVRQRAQEIETRMRLAGLTVPSSLKRSNSLAKLASLDLSSEDLCSACSSDAGTLLLMTLSPEPDLHSPEASLPGDPKS